ncbi:MAG: bifunctional 5,10-methylene-tetrahydrofolate dehydrogenase/5,10-methylene-tetrahydrofolate cyclohydrolase [Cenarchaeum symbiont of Oopsacas minuta]|nr:bifunctional 5,10-methylene-tetrahydrofolate dehydrogenase/5,10-methylene-tetrahydrofolate cyclohydrolase [Cenarchaeum symbiont of Oopsacas minuta]
MAGVKLDGLMVAGLVKDRVKSAVSHLKNDGIEPCLATVLVGDDSASATYVHNKHIACSKVGITTRDHRMPSTTTKDELEDLIDELNADSTVHGILVQIPLPKSIDEFMIISRISPLKDVDGLTPYNVGLLAYGKSTFVPCTPMGIMEIFDHYKIPISRMNAVVINRSALVGKPIQNLLLAKDATVALCHSKTKDLPSYTQEADIIVTAVGDRDKFELKPEMIKDGAVVIDVATNRHNGVLSGDCDFDKMIQRASFVTPVPGGVGPMTIAMLLKNTVTAASLRHSVED